MSKRNDTAVLPAPTFPASIDDAQRQGALAAMQALGVLVASAENVSNCGNLPEDFFSWRFDDAAKLADSLGVMPQFARGAIMALAGFIHYSTHTGEPNLDCWLPVTAMSQEQWRQEVDVMREEYRSDAAGVCVGEAT
jgi:hypothetical protein